MGYESFLVKRLKEDELKVNFESVKQALESVGITVSYRELPTERDGEPACLMSFSWDDGELREKRTRNAGGKMVFHGNACWKDYDALKAAGKKKTEICKILGIPRTTLYRRLKERKAYQESYMFENNPFSFDDGDFRI